LKRQGRYIGVHVIKLTYSISLYFQRYALWKLGFMNALEISFKQISLALLLELIFWEVSDLAILKRHRRDLGVHFVTILYDGSIYVRRYSLWKLGSLNGPEISFKPVSLEFSL